MVDTSPVITVVEGDVFQRWLGRLRDYRAVARINARLRQIFGRRLEVTMRGEYRRWDAAEYIRNEEEARLYLEACAEQDPGDGSLIRVALGDIVRVRNMSSLARKVGMTRQGLYKALSTEGNPSFATVMRITRALGMDLRITFGADPGNGQQAVSPGSSPHPAR